MKNLIMNLTYNNARMKNTEGKNSNENIQIE